MEKYERIAGMLMMATLMCVCVQGEEVEAKRTSVMFQDELGGGRASFESGHDGGLSNGKGKGKKGRKSGILVR